MLLPNLKIPELTFQCGKHNQKAISYCKAKFCNERLICGQCNHPHLEVESVGSLFDFTAVLKNLPLQDTCNNALFVEQFLMSLGETFQSIKMIEENLIWLHQMLLSSSEIFRQSKASMQSLQLLMVQILNYISQFRDSGQVTDSKQLSECIQWFLTLRAASSSKLLFGDRDCEMMRAANIEVSSLSHLLSEKVGALAKQFHSMKEVGSLPKPEATLPQQIQVSKPQKNSTLTMQDPLPVSHHKASEISTNQKTKDISKETAPTKILRPEVQKKPPKVKEQKDTTSKTTRAPTRGKSDFLEDTQIKEETHIKEETKENSILIEEEPKTEPLETKTVIDTTPKEKLEALQQSLQKLQETPDSNPETELEIQKLKEEIENAQELKKIAITLIGKPESPLVRDVKRELSRVLQEFKKNTDKEKSPEYFRKAALQLLQEKKQEVIQDFKERLSEEGTRDLISKMKESRVDFKNEINKLIEMCLEYQLRWGKVQPEIVTLETESIDFRTYQNTLEKYFRLRLLPPNYEYFLNQYFEFKECQVNLEHFMIRLRKMDLATSIQRAFSHDTNEVEAQLILQGLEEISLNKAKSIRDEITRVFQGKYSLGDQTEELEEIVNQGERLQKELKQALESYETHQSLEQLQKDAENCLESRVYLEEMALLRTISPTLLQKAAFPQRRAKKTTYKPEPKGNSSENEGNDECRETRSLKKPKTDEVPDLNVIGRSTRTKSKMIE